MTQTPQDEPRRESPEGETQPSAWSAPAGEPPSYPYAPKPDQSDRPPSEPHAPSGTGGYGGGYPPSGGYAAGGYPTGGYAAGGYVAPVQPTPTSTIVLLVLSGLATLSCWFTLAGIAPLILAIMAMTKQKVDPAATPRLTRIGWIVFAVGVGVILLVFGVFLTMAIVQSSTSPGF
jgi:hypothetical protein